MAAESSSSAVRIFSTARAKRRAVKSKTSLNGEGLELPSTAKIRNLTELDPNEKKKLPGDLKAGVRFTQTMHKSISGSSIESIDSLKQIQTSIDITLTSANQQQKLKTLASLLPDEVLSNLGSMKSRVYKVAILFPDVSGFTELCQKYDKTGKGGPSRLTAVLNGYIGSMIKIVLSRNGDVLKFGGDAFLCTWRATDELDLSEMVQRAIESAIYIQKNCGEHQTDVGVKLRVKVAVSAGTAVFSNIGTRSRKYYVIFGPPVLDVREAERLCTPGDVIVSPSAWRLVKNYMLYSFTYHADQKHVKVHDFGPLWTRNSLDEKKKKVGQNEGTRPFLKNSLSLEINELRPFILPPVMRSIDLNRSLDYLTEMRQIAIVFLNIITDYEEMDPQDVVVLSNKVFRIVANTVDNSGGATNKLTLFDKDMAVLTVFGLKGFKHALASQVALKCAYSCVEQLKKLRIQSVAAGVTTGMAYCGVIGHALRKEYTVMGHPVNMAARLMCAYENMVSCDRNTFLNSKLESGHFEVLKLEFMKGIQSAGPFYKFNINPKRLKLKLGQETQPLLGRAKEVRQYKDFLRQGMQRKSEINFFIIFGTARIGKSRLVQRLINITQKYFSQLYSEKDEEKDSPNREIHIVPLKEENSEFSYSTIRLMFQPLLGIGDMSSVEQREDKILLKLGNFNELNLLALFNQVFNVNFDLTPQYLSLDSEELPKAQMIWLQRLYNRCFPRNRKSLIVIEDAEFVDDASWQFLVWCSIQSKRALYLMTIGEKKVLSEFAWDCLSKMKSTTITLSEIDKWYYLGLACQILGVQAIPVELESTLQNYKSSGNPGWLESFLLSLIQSNNIYITNIPARKMKTLELVAPPEFMLTNTASKERHNSNWMDCLETFESNTEIISSKIRVCLLNPEFHLGNENEGELMMDVMFLKTIDTLEPLEQLVLKAGSVLGTNLIRSALEYIISTETKVENRQFARAIQNLFQRKILKCAKGDLTHLNLLVHKRIIMETSFQKEVICECVGVEIPDNCLDLPKYANCGYMQFSFSSFRETLYNLLLDHQKKRFHYSCIEYFRENTYRCKSCNNERFTNVLGIKEDNELILVCTKTPMHGIRATKLDLKLNVSTPLSPRNLQISRKGISRRSSHTDLNAIGIYDMGDCQCSEILSLVYSVMLEHATAAGRKDLMLEINLELAALSLTMYNIPLTMQILQNALTIVEKIKEEKEQSELCSAFIYSKIYTLMGATKINTGRMEESLELLKKSLQYLDKSFPRTESGTRILILKEMIKLRLLVQIMPGKFLGRVSEKKAHFIDLFSECMGLISVAYMYMKNLRNAKYASLCSLTRALESNRNLYGLCTAYTNVIEVFYSLGHLETCVKLEMFAIELLKKCSMSKIELYEWEAICRLCKAIFHTRHVRGEIGKAVQIGFQSIKIAGSIRITSLKLDLFPDLIFALVQMHRLSEAASLLQELEFVSRLDSDRSTRLWYYSLSLDFQLYTGFTIVTFDGCEDFVKTVDSALVRDPAAKFRLYTSMWLWCVRNSEWEFVKSYGKLIKNSNVVDEDAPATVFTRLERLEGLMILLVNRMDARNIHSINLIFADIHAIMHKLEKNVKIVKLFKPRYLLLKTYYKQIRYKDNSYDRLLNKVQIQAEKIEDKNLCQWIMHLKMLWSNAVSQFQRECWIEHSRKNILEWHESDKESRPIIPYSLPLPKF